MLNNTIQLRGNITLIFVLLQSSAIRGLEGAMLILDIIYVIEEGNMEVSYFVNGRI
jgi:hypothetical protein